MTKLYVEYLVKLTLVVLGVYSIYLMALITWQYIPANNEVAFLVFKDHVIDKLYYRVAFFSHVYMSIFTLIAGCIQLIPWVKSAWPKLHKHLGRFYVLSILLVTAPSGFVMALYANGGLLSQISFVIQALIWWMFTWLAFDYIKKGEKTMHYKFVWRSMALTLSAITLRWWKYLIVSTLALGPMDTYRIVAWLGWVGNLLVVEIFLYFYINPSEKETFGSDEMLS